MRALRELFARAPSVEVRSVAVLSADMDSVFVRVKVGGVTSLVSLEDLVRSYQKVAHADNYLRSAVDGANKYSSKTTTKEWR